MFETEDFNSEQAQNRSSIFITQVHVDAQMCSRWLLTSTAATIGSRLADHERNRS